MKKATCLLVAAGVLLCAGTAMAQWKRAKAPQKRSYYDLFGESLNCRLWSIGLVDINGLNGGSSLLKGEAWGFITDQGYKVNYSDKYKKVSATFKVGLHMWGVTGRPSFSTELFDVKLTPFTFQKIWFPGFQGTFKSPSHKANFFFSRTSNTSLGYPPKGTTETEFSTYFIGVKDDYKLKLDEINLTLSGTYIHHWKDYNLINETSYFGNVKDDAPGTITLRFSDDSPQDGYGAQLWDLQYSVDGGAYTAVTLVPVPMEANGASLFECVIPVPANAKGVKFSISVANDYRIEIKSDKAGYATMLRAPGNPKDDIAQQVTYNYGLSSASDMIAVTADGTVYGANVSVECDFNNQYRKFPTKDGERDLAMYPVFYVKADRKIDFTGLKFIDNKLSVSGDYFFTHPSFSSPNWSTPFEGFTYVDDNDDYDWYYDKTGRCGGSGTSNPVPTYHIAYDRDSDNVGDWEQDMMLFIVDPPKFWIGNDRNNNGTADVYEDDDLPDYPVKLDRHGFGFNLNYPLLKDVELNGGYDYFTEAFGDKKTTNLFLTTKYSAKVSNLGEILIWHNIKKVEDNLADDLVELKSSDSAYDVFSGKDLLAFEDSLLNNFYIETKYNGFTGLTVSNKFRYDYNYQFTDTRSVRWAGLITNAAYDYKPTKLFTLTPQWKCWVEKGSSSPYSSLYLSERQTNAFLLKAVYKLFDKTTFTAGVQYKLVRLPLESVNDYDGLTIAAQLVSKAGSYPLILGYVRNMTYNMADASLNGKEETIFLKIYSPR